jgi:NedA-like, galactose-binding domain
MSNILNSIDYTEWHHLNFEIGFYIDKGDAETSLQWETKRDEFITNHQIDASKPVTLDPDKPGELDDYEVISVMSSGSDNTINVAANVLDKSQDTRWSNEQDGCWIRLDLGTSVVVGSVGVTWYKGSTRTMKFDILAGDDPNALVLVNSFTSKKLATEEWYSLGDGKLSARYVELVGHGNDLNLYTSITEMVVNAKDKSTQVPPDPIPCPTGQHRDSSGNCIPDAPQGQYPIPVGFEVDGNVSLGFKFWGRTTTNYASGGSGPSLRWDNTDIQNVNVIAGYEVNLGTTHGKRGDDNIDLKCRGNSHSDGKGGWYLPFINWYVNHKASDSGCGKEYPHPSTTHSAWNVDDPKPDIGDLGDGQWHGFLVAVFNDKNGVPTMMAWYNKGATGKMVDYVYLGKSKDTGNMKPGPVCTKISQLGGGNQSLQIRIDERADAKVRNTFAYACKTVPE